tara:strand:+ start:1668 stop:1964 length:297 start_codon:yes stop_codon:yes gene_type:complete
MDFGKELKDYLERKNITAGVFAMCAYLSPNSIYAILNNKRPPGPLISRKILIATNGEVDFNIQYKARDIYTKKLSVFKKRIRAPKKQKVYSESSMGSS